MLAKLETKIPPMIVLGACIVLAIAFGFALPGGPLEWPFQGALIAIVLVAGVCLATAAKRAFDRAGTTLDPTAPADATTLVTTGIYRWTRNPMYLGQALVLTACVLLIDRPGAFLAVPLFIAYITRLQILPEEAVLHRRFPSVYLAYCERARRWL